DPVADLRHLQIGGNGVRNALELACLLELANEIPEVAIFHGNGNRAYSPEGTKVNIPVISFQGKVWPWTTSRRQRRRHRHAAPVHRHRQGMSAQCRGLRRRPTACPPHGASAWSKGPRRQTRGRSRGRSGAGCARWVTGRRSCLTSVPRIWVLPYWSPW